MRTSDLGYCFRCTCETCTPINEERERIRLREEEKEERRIALRATNRERERYRRELRERQAAMIWMLMNHVQDSWLDTTYTLALIGEMLGMTMAQVDARRKVYAGILGTRADLLETDKYDEVSLRLQAAGALGGPLSYLRKHNWVKLPTTKFTELPPDTWPITRVHEQGRR